MFSGGFYVRTKDTNLMFRDFWLIRRFEPGLVYAQMPIVRPTLQCTQQMFLEEREM